MKKDQMVRVRKDHIFHPGRIGFFQFEGTGPSTGWVMFSTAPGGNVLFSVKKEDFTVL